MARLRHDAPEAEQRSRNNKIHSHGKYVNLLSDLKKHCFLVPLIFLNIQLVFLMLYLQFVFGNLFVKISPCKHERQRWRTHHPLHERSITAVNECTFSCQSPAFKMFIQIKRKILGRQRFTCRATTDENQPLHSFWPLNSNLIFTVPEKYCGYINN